MYNFTKNFQKYSLNTSLTRCSLLCYIRAKWDRACWKSNLKYYVTTCHILKWKMHSIEIQSDSTDVIYFIRSSIGKLDLILEFQRACMKGFRGPRARGSGVEKCRLYTIAYFVSNLYAYGPYLNIKAVFLISIAY